MKSISTSIVLFLSLSQLIAQAQFVDQSNSSGINNVGFNRGVSIVDYDQDGWEDIYFTRLNGANRLYHNNGDGTYSELSEAAGLAYSGSSMSAAWGDLDNDGWPDLVLGNRDVASKIYHNNGDGTFTDQSEMVGFATTAKVQAVLLADIDNDGWLDIYLANFDSPNALYINQGSGQFKEESQNRGALDDKKAMGSIFFDYDNDGDQDLYLTHDANQANILYQNDGAGYFTDVSVGAGVNFAGQGMGVDAADYNNDGYLDLYITNLYENVLFLNERDGTFSDQSLVAGVTDRGMGWGTTWIDYDNDGWQDLYVCNETLFPVNGTFYDNVMYQNQGNGSFSPTSANSVLASPLGGYGAVAADLDKNGLVDIVIANSGLSDGNQLLQNQAQNDYHWVVFSLEGTQSNRSAIGARVTIKAGELELCDQIMSGNSFASQNSLRLHFGLGEASQIDELDIYWPSGQKEHFEQLEVDRYYEIIEQSSITSTEELWRNRNFQAKIYPNPVQENLTFALFLQHSIGSFTYRILDSTGRVLLQQAALIHSPGQYRPSLSIPKNWSNGTYYLDLSHGKDHQVLPFMLQR